MTDSKLQTFEEFQERYEAEHVVLNLDDFHKAIWDGGKAAGVASQQADLKRLSTEVFERDELLASQQAEIERQREHFLADIGAQAKIDREHYARSEAVVEAAREPSKLLSAMIAAEDWSTFSAPAMRMRIEFAAFALRAALAALDEVRPQ